MGAAERQRAHRTGCAVRGKRQHQQRARAAKMKMWPPSCFLQTLVGCELKDVGYHAGYFPKMRAEVGQRCIISLWPSMAPSSGRSRQQDGTAHVHRVTCEDDERRRPDSRSEASDEPRLAPRDALRTSRIIDEALSNNCH